VVQIPQVCCRSFVLVIVRSMAEEPFCLNGSSMSFQRTYASQTHTMTPCRTSGIELLL
jgi:hypothetical protein